MKKTPEPAQISSKANQPKRSKQETFKLNHKIITFAIVANLVYATIEYICGLISSSIALTADASQNYCDVLVLAVSLIANKIASKKETAKWTFGFGRITILAAEINSLIMLGVATYIIFESFHRLINPVGIEANFVIIIAAIGIVVNAAIAFALSKNTDDLNMKSSFMEVLFDTVSSVGAVLSGIIISLTGVTWIDSAVGFVIAILMIVNAARIFMQGMKIMLEGKPNDVNFDKVEKILLKDERIIKVDDVHIWTIRSNYNTLTCHLTISESNLPQGFEIVQKAKKRLVKECNINHTTIELEPQTQTPGELHEEH